MRQSYICSVCDAEGHLARENSQISTHMHVLLIIQVFGTIQHSILHLIWQNIYDYIHNYLKQSGKYNKLSDRRLKISPRDQYNSTLYNYRSLFDNRYHWGAISWLGGNPKRRTDYDEFFGLYAKNNTQIHLIIYHIYSKYFIVAKILIIDAFLK